MKETVQEKKYKQAIVEWNKTYPMGTPVIVAAPMGKQIQTTTWSIAFLSDTGTPVILCNGSTRSVSLYKVKPVKVEGEKV